MNKSNIKIADEVDRVGAQPRGWDLALFNKADAKGMPHAAKEMENAKLESSFILFSAWTEAIHHFADHGKGKMSVTRTSVIVEEKEDNDSRF